VKGPCQFGSVGQDDRLATQNAERTCSQRHGIKRAHGGAILVEHTYGQEHVPTLPEAPRAHAAAAHRGSNLLFRTKTQQILRDATLALELICCELALTYKKQKPVQNYQFHRRILCMAEKYGIEIV